MEKSTQAVAADVVALALAKVKGDRDAVAPGSYAGRVVVELDYTLKVGEPYPQRIVGKVPWIALAAVLLSKVNGATLETAVREALALDAGDPDAVEAVNARADDVMESLTEATVTTCRGKVTGSATVRDIRAA